MFFWQFLQNVFCASVGGKAEFCLGVIMGKSRHEAQLVFLLQLFNEQQMFKAIGVGDLVQLLWLEPALYEHLKRSATNSFTAFCKQYCHAALLDNVDGVPKRVERAGKRRMC